jgi:hypothetical protein
MARVHVPQHGGEIAISRDGDEPTVFKVSDDGFTTVAEADLPTFLAFVEGSKPEAKPASPSKEQ